MALVPPEGGPVGGTPVGAPLGGRPLAPALGVAFPQATQTTRTKHEKEQGYSYCICRVCCGEGLGAWERTM